MHILSEYYGTIIVSNLRLIQSKYSTDNCRSLHGTNGARIDDNSLLVWNVSGFRKARWQQSVKGKTFL